jgi:hypothetical protein
MMTRLRQAGVLPPTNVTLLNPNYLRRYPPPLQIGSDPLHFHKLLYINDLICCVNGQGAFPLLCGFILNR